VAAAELAKVKKRIDERSKKERQMYAKMFG
jgi:hypothetical protein